MEKKILRKIEILRKKLNQFESTDSLVDARVVALSQELDCLLNQYYKSSVQQLSLWWDGYIDKNAAAQKADGAFSVL